MKESDTQDLQKVIQSIGASERGNKQMEGKAKIMRFFLSSRWTLLHFHYW